jgi:hypothetical protein
MFLEARYAGPHQAPCQGIQLRVSLCVCPFLAGDFIHEADLTGNVAGKCHACDLQLSERAGHEFRGRVWIKTRPCTALASSFPCEGHIQLECLAQIQKEENR